MELMKQLLSGNVACGDLQEIFSSFSMSYSDQYPHFCIMKKIIGFFALFLGLQTGIVAQTIDSRYLNTRILSVPDEIAPNIPEGLLSGNEVASFDTTLPSRIIASMNATYAKQRLYAQYGIAVSIHVPGHPDWSGAIGLNDAITPMDTNLVFEIASNTKTFVTALIMKLQDQGKLSIKDSIGKYLT